MKKSDARIARDADATMGSRHAVDVPHVKPDAAVGQSHKVGHGTVVEIGAVVDILFGDAVCADGGDVRWHTGANRKIHGNLLIDVANAALVAEVDNNAFLPGAVEQCVVFPCAKCQPVVIAAPEFIVIGRWGGLTERQHAIARDVRPAHNAPDGRRRDNRRRRVIGLPRVVIHLVIIDLAARETNGQA